MDFNNFPNSSSCRCLSSSLPFFSLSCYDFISKPLYLAAFLFLYLYIPPPVSTTPYLSVHPFSYLPPSFCPALLFISPRVCLVYLIEIVVFELLSLWAIYPRNEATKKDVFHSGQRGGFKRDERDDHLEQWPGANVLKLFSFSADDEVK
jgi:hypothetical protein